MLGESKADVSGMDCVMVHLIIVACYEQEECHCTLAGACITERRIWRVSFDR